MPLTMAELWALPVMLPQHLEYLVKTISRITHIPFAPLPVTRTLPGELPQRRSSPLCIVSLRALSVQDWQLLL